MRFKGPRVGRAAHEHPTECAQDGQGGSGPQETQGCTSCGPATTMTVGGFNECTQDGQGGHGPQETQGRTEGPRVGRAAHEHPTECAQDGQGGFGPQETQGCTSCRHATTTTIGGFNECTQDGQGGHGPQETQGCTVPLYCVNKAHAVQLGNPQQPRGSLGVQKAQCTVATNAVTRTRATGPTECTQDGQGGISPQETQGCTRPTKEGRGRVVDLECTQDGQGGFGPQETQGRTGRFEASRRPPPPWPGAWVNPGVGSGRDPRRTPLAVGPAGEGSDPRTPRAVAQMCPSEFMRKAGVAFPHVAAVPQQQGKKSARRKVGWALSSSLVGPG